METKVKKYSASEIASMAMENENTNAPIERYEVDRWWIRNVWGKMTRREKREWSKERINQCLPSDILNACSKQLIGRAVSEICDFFNHC